MKRIVNSLLVLFFPLLIHAQDNGIIKIRNLYYKASANKSDADIFLNTLQNKPDIDASLVEGYKGMAFMMKANFFFNPYSKLSYFLKGKNMLENAIKTDQKNVELRFLRYCIQTNVPGFLSYSSKITEDKTILLLSFKQLADVDLKSRISAYMSASKECTKEEKQVFKENHNN